MSENEEIKDLPSDEPIADTVDQETAPTEAENTPKTILDLIYTELDKADVDYDIDEIKDLYEKFANHGKIDLMRDRAEIEKHVELAKLVDTMIESYDEMSTTTQAFEKMLNPTDDDEESEDDEDTENVVKDFITPDLPEDSSKEELSNTVNDIRRDIKAAAIVLAIVTSFYNKTHPNTTVWDDVIEKLEKDKITLQTSSSINASRKLKFVEDTLERVMDASRQFVTLMLPKLEIEKRNAKIVKEFFDTDPGRAIRKAGFSADYIANFRAFFVSECAFASDYHDLEAFSMADMYDAASILCYHVSKIINAERKHENYKSIVYKLMIIKVLEIDQLCPINDPDTHASIPRFVDGAETMNSITRQKCFKEYLPILEKYISILRKKK